MGLLLFLARPNNEWGVGALRILKESSLKSTIFFFLLAALSPDATCAQLPLPSAITPHEIVCTHDYSEGAVADRDGNLYFSHGKVISKFTPKGILTQWAE